MVPLDRAEFVKERAGRAAALRKTEEQQRRANLERQQSSHAVAADMGLLGDQLDDLSSLTAAATSADGDAAPHCRSRLRHAPITSAPGWSSR